MKYGLALGSNLGDRKARLTEARALLLEASSDPSSLLCAGLYESAPVGCEPGAPSFLNTCLELDFELSPARLLELTQGIETALGRPGHRLANAPRSIDIDILYAGDEKIAEPDLVIPHPRLTQRRFVLEPLSEIRPGLMLPGEKQAVVDLLQELDTDEPPLALAANQW